jgi:hypothetical protein
VLAVLGGLAGCGSGHEGAAVGPTGQVRPVEQLAAGPILPAPDPGRIEYNADTRTLTFYELPESGRWMIHCSGDKYSVQAGPEHRLPDTANIDKSYVYYVRAGGQWSRPVSVRTIQDSRTAYPPN